MSGSPARRWERKNKNKATEPHALEIDDGRFLFRPRMGAQGLYLFAQAETNPPLMFDAIEFLLVEEDGDEEGAAFKRFLELDLDGPEELMEFLGEVGELYGASDVGESSPSPEQPSSDEGSSSPTSSGTTGSTSKKKSKDLTSSGSSA